MACISGNIASEQKVRGIKDVVWIQPLSFRSGPQALRTLLKPIGGGVEYVISSLDDEGETIVHSEGRLAFGNGADAPAGDERVSLDTLKAQCTGAEGGAAFYEKFGGFGLHYGPAFQTVQALWVNGSFALAKLNIAGHLKGEFGQFILHPSMIDGALQTAAALMASLAPQTLFLPFAIDEIELIRPVTQSCYAYAERAGSHAQNRGGVTKFNIRLVSENGEVLLKIKNLYVRPLARPLHDSHAVAAAGASAGGRLVAL
jgi:hypothetical protein